MASEFLSLTTRAHLQNLVDDGFEESLTLDYKASAALSRAGRAPDELCKDISALANSAGGQIIYCIEEDKQTGKPKRIDDGVDDPKITREWIIQILSSRVRPRIDGVSVERIDLENGRSGFVITVTPTRTGPHQAPDKKYYKRFELHSVPMEDYEIRDVFNRDVQPDLHVDFSFQNSDGYKLSSSTLNDPLPLTIRIVNSSSKPAFYVALTIFVPFPLHIRSDGNLTRHQLAEVPDLGRCHKLSRLLTAPPEFPVFRERPLVCGHFQLVIPSGLLDRALGIGWHVITPGCDNNGIAKLSLNDGSIFIERPWINYVLLHEHSRVTRVLSPY